MAGAGRLHEPVGIGEGRGGGWHKQLWHPSHIRSAQLPVAAAAELRATRAALQVSQLIGGRARACATSGTLLLAGRQAGWWWWGGWASGPFMCAIFEIKKMEFY